MRKNLADRIGKLEEKRKPRLIATVTDLMLWASDMLGDDEVELSPEMQGLVDEANKYAAEKTRDEENDGN
jgi:hypothetical protein